MSRWRFSFRAAGAMMRQFYRRLLLHMTPTFPGQDYRRFQLKRRMRPRTVYFPRSQMRVTSKSVPFLFLGKISAQNPKFMPPSDKCSNKTVPSPFPGKIASANPYDDLSQPQLELQVRVFPLTGRDRARQLYVYISQPQLQFQICTFPFAGQDRGSKWVHLTLPAKNAPFGRDICRDREGIFG